MSNISDDVILKVDHLSMFFGKHGFVKKAVNDVSFDVKRGEVFGLVGESGCGKTTTGRTIIRLYDATSGSVYYNGQRVVAGTRSYEVEKKKLKEELKSFAKDKSTDHSERKAEINKRIAELNEEIKSAKSDHKHYNDKCIAADLKKLDEEYKPQLEKATGENKVKLEKEYREKKYSIKHTKYITKMQMIYQDPVASLDPRMTVREIIAEGLRIKGVKDQAYIDEQVYKMLETVGLVREHADRYPHEFSGGQRQRIGIARSIIMNPELIIADEPISALDVSIRAQVINLLNDLRNSMGLTVLFIAHDLSVVKYFSDRIGVMYFGNMVELATSDELFKHPLHPYTKSLLSAIPLPDPETEKGRIRIKYNPLVDHEYTTEKPQFREVCPGHFVRCTAKEFEKYQDVLREDGTI